MGAFDQGFFTGPHGLEFILGIVFLALVTGFTGAPFFVWTLLGAAALWGGSAPVWLWAAFGVVAIIGNIKPLRALVVSPLVMKVMKSMGIIPTISETERTALEAGVVWVESDLFSGKPDFKKLMTETYPELTPEEKAFVDGPVERLCEVSDDWQITIDKKLPDAAWDIIKKEKFLGMIIPKEYGGLGFTALAHSAVIAKLASRSVPTTISVMVPNSLGPAELLIHYGTQAQKDHYLPRLARGEEIPCFALTEPTAGSDAGSITSEGTVFKGDDGKLYMKLNWNKRWITLAAISTTLGLAFRLRDPNNFLGKGEDVGITCALIPSNTKGVVIGRRHEPLGVPFYNCPTQGKDVVISVDAIVGGVEGAGHGWKMLMECLAAGRGISLPAQSVGGVKLATRVASNHAFVRKQFGISIGKFEGIEEPLARIAGGTYLLEAMRRYTLGALDKGMKPPVITAIAKYNATEVGRKLVNDAMDILGGAGISRGPRNLLANIYIATPIGITVEGANIMTRTLIIFGQGALRAHPYAFKEVKTLEAGDKSGFDRAFWGHIGHVVRNTFRSVLLSLTRGRLATSPVGGPAKRYFQKLAWASATFAIMSDLAMASLGGSLKMKEKITGRFADILSWMYIATAVLRRFEAEGQRKEDIPYLNYSMHVAFGEIQKAFDGIFANLPVPGLTWFFAGPLKAWSSLNTLAIDLKDDVTHKIAASVMVNSAQRDHLTDGIYIPKDVHQALGRLENAFKICKQAEEAEKKIRQAIHAKKLPKAKVSKSIDEALKIGVITAAEAAVIRSAEEVRNDAIQVDDFSQDEYLGKGHQPDPAYARVRGTEAAPLRVLSN